ncbi:MAG: glycosyltransferase family 1 protein [Candidatus Andersenbacteria bacterium]
MSDTPSRIVIEARSLSGAGGGVQTYTRELITNILAERTSHSIDVLYGSEDQRNAFPDATSHVVSLASEVLLPSWLHKKVPHLLNEIQPSVVHFTKADVPKRKRWPTIVTIYDVIPLLLPQTQSLLRRLYWPRALSRAAQQSDHILTISQASKQGIIQHLGVDPERITVTEPGIDLGHFKPVDVTSARNVLQQYDISLPYILFVGTRDARKNIPALLRAVDRLKKDIPHNIVIVGRAGDKEDDTEQVIRKLGLVDRVHLLGKVAYEHLPALYSAAEVFVWPSVYEGWGFPPVEAMACGTPVVTSDGGSLPEAVGAGGVVVPFSEEVVHKRYDDTDFINRLSDEIARVLSDRDLKARLRESGLTHAAQFSWKTLAQRTLAVYDQVAVR